MTNTFCCFNYCTQCTTAISAKLTSIIIVFFFVVSIFSYCNVASVFFRLSSIFCLDFPYWNLKGSEDLNYLNKAFIHKEQIE